MFIVLVFICQLACPMEFRIIPDVHEMQACPGYEFDMDFADVNFDFDDDGFMIIDGNLTILEDIVAPYPIYIHSDRMERGVWNPSFISKPVKNFCAGLMDPLEVWYPVTKQLRDLKCPFPAGHIIMFDNIKYKFPVSISPQFLGDWRVFIEHRDVAKDSEPLHCMFQYVNVIEI